jgi:hypothetical protein
VYAHAGVYLPGDPKAADAATGQGILPISIAQAFMKGLTIQAGQVLMLYSHIAYALVLVY